MYWLLKLHIATVLLSLAGFVVRGVWMLRGSSLLRARWVRATPHIVDTLLLASGIGLIFTLHLYPTQQPWLVAKLVALVVYIVLGAIALKRGRTRGCGPAPGWRHWPCFSTSSPSRLRSRSYRSVRCEAGQGGASCLKSLSICRSAAI